MYTLRIIDQSKVGAEERRNIYLGESYDVLMKAPIVYKENKPVEKEEDSSFGEALREFDKLLPNEVIMKDNIVGFVYANGATYPIRYHNVVYIVGNTGQTIERVYGIYEKY